jgi:hypothetical protein
VEERGIDIDGLLTVGEDEDLGVKEIPPELFPELPVHELDLLEEDPNPLDLEDEPPEKLEREPLEDPNPPDLEEPLENPPPLFGAANNDIEVKVLKVKAKKDLLVNMEPPNDALF